MKLHTKYERSGPFNFTHEDSLSFPYMGLCKTSDPTLAGAIFDPKDFNLNNLGRGPLDKAIYQDF